MRQPLRAPAFGLLDQTRPNRAVYLDLGTAIQSPVTSAALPLLLSSSPRLIPAGSAFAQAEEKRIDGQSN